MTACQVLVKLSESGMTEVMACSAASAGSALPEPSIGADPWAPGPLSGWQLTRLEGSGCAHRLDAGTWHAVRTVGARLTLSYTNEKADLYE